MKTIRLSNHARIQCIERGTNEAEIVEAVNHGIPYAAKNERIMYRYEMKYMKNWQGRFYACKQVAPVIVEEEDEIVVVTVYTFYY